MKCQQFSCVSGYWILELSLFSIFLQELKDKWNNGTIIEWSGQT